MFICKGDKTMHRALLFLKAVAVTAAAIICLVFLYALYSSPVFGSGERYEFYKGTSSDEIFCSRTPLGKLTCPNVKGECAFYAGDRVEEIRSEFEAEILFIEESAGTVNYYCYSPALENGVLLNGYTVNLHIAYSGERTAAGTPIIFGGY